MVAALKLTTMPPNTRILQDDSASALLEQLRDRSLRSSQVRNLVGQITQILAKSVITPPSPNEQIAIIVILRSGMAMMEPFVSQLPSDTDNVIYHLGLFREKETLQPVEYYNKLPRKSPRIKHGYVLDPLIATGGTATASIQILKDWGLEKITFVSLLASNSGLDAVAGTWSEGVEFIVGAVDQGLDSKGFIQPGLGDIGDRLFGTTN
ncbi:uracil phosphoribosyltransferase [Capronia coronata CBS 617.96]|uniref:uracil phosphoribosyltransferase n=1 Tax=Capronia coronata CBS 617.96 TaxID=1182541 RepID=W9Z7J7_9EURO|nr:uracil phosphoribosyltransferase [Capronia coronata CBS 617.96]EXJ90479.1 uracil phosphoribosyltransferase [Capronia coronata CBS 617.96]